MKTKPEEKAKELVVIFGKELAIKCVDEILCNPYLDLRDLAERVHDEFWEQVRNEIEKL